jgi:hypothetical protein
MEQALPTSVILHAGGSCIGLAGVIASVWWLNKNPMDLTPQLITALTIVFILFLAVFILIESISHGAMEKNYGFDPLRGVVFE